MSVTTAPGAVALDPGSLRGPLTARRAVAWGVPLIFLVMALASARALGLEALVLADAAEGFERFFARALPPTLSDPRTTMLHLLQSLSMALAGTALAAVLSLLLAVLAARPTAPNGGVRSAALGIIVACRAVPDVVFAIFFVAALGIGPLAGVLALGLHSIGMLGKLHIEAIERSDSGIDEAIAVSGAGPLQRLVAGTLPQIVPAGVAALLFRFDINVRSSVLLGAVGAGGIGLDLKTAFGFTNYQEAIGVSLVIVVVVVLVEAASTVLRRILITPPKGHDAPTPRAGRVPWTLRRQVLHLSGWGGLVLAVAALWGSGLTPASAIGLVGTSIETLPAFWPPDFAAVSDIWLVGLAEICAIAGLATVLGGLLGTAIGLAAANNLVSTWLFVSARALVSLMRSIPDLLLLLVCVAVVGLTDGAVAGAIALSIHTTSFVAKLVADAAEEVDPGPREALRAAGSSRSQELVTTVLGQLSPALVGIWFYALDVNLRAFVLLSVVGAGELGFALSQSMRLRNFEVVTALVLPIFVLVLLVELVSTRCRALLR